MGSNCAVSYIWPANCPFSQWETELRRTQLYEVGSKELCSQLGARPLNTTHVWPRSAAPQPEGLDWESILRREETGVPEKPSKSGWDRLKLNPHTTFVVEVEDVIDVQGVQHRKSIQMANHPDINLVQHGLTSVNRREPVFPFGASRTRRRVRAVSFGPTNYEQCLHLSEWVTHLHIGVPASPVPELSFLPAPYRGWTRAGKKKSPG